MKDKIKEILEKEGFYKSTHMIISKILASFDDPILHSKAQKHLTINDLSNDIIDLYKKEFNEKEIDDLLSFYGSDTGKKVLSFKRDSNTKINNITKNWVDEKQKLIIADLNISDK